MFPDKSVLPLVAGEEVVEEAWELDVDMVVDQVEATVVVKVVSEGLLTTERMNSRRENLTGGERTCCSVCGKGGEP